MAAKVGGGLGGLDRGEAVAVFCVSALHFTTQNGWGGGALVQALVLGAPWDVAMPYKQFQHIKSAIHFQGDDEVQEREGNRPYICKIGIVMEMIALNCQHSYSMGQNVAIDEITIGMSSASKYRRITKHKKSHESIQMFAIGESTDGLQYCWLFHLDENDGEVGKIHKHVMRLVGELEHDAGYHIYMDNLFISTNTLNAVREMGHGAAGTCRARRGMPPSIEGLKSVNGKPNNAAIAHGVKDQGDWVYSLNERYNLLSVAWFNSGICHFMSNCHDADESVIERCKKRHRGKLTINAPLVAARYNVHMTAIDDIDRVLELLSTRLLIHKWYLALFFYLFDTGTNNGYTLWKKHNTDEWSQKVARRVQYMMLCEDMLKLSGGGDVGGPLQDVLAPSNLTATSDAGYLTANCLNPTHFMCRRRLNDRHFIAAHEDPTMCSNCVLCSHTQPGKVGQLRVHYFCSQCGVFLHVDCFEEWHQKLAPASPRFTLPAVLKKALSRK